MLKLNFDIKKANDSQIETFLAGYDDLWRLTKLISIKHSLEEREALKKKLKSYYGPSFSVDSDDYIYNQATNGLLFSAVSELVMYMEDLFVLMKYIREEEEFIKKVVVYYANKIGKLPEKISKMDLEAILKVFLIPSKDYIDKLVEETNSPLEHLDIYSEGISNVYRYLDDIIISFKKYRFIYNQYKHGLTVALRPYGNNLSKKELNRRKNSLDSSLFCYDNTDIGKAIERNPNQPFIIPSITENLQPGITSLNNNNNLLRYSGVYDVSIDELIKLGSKVHSLIRILSNNRYDFVKPHHSEANTFYLPVPTRKDKLRLVQFSLVPKDSLLKLNDFKVEI
ncbi:hypothetical protein ACQKMV_07895 [Lysinibacillus sp. NPDC094403]|uniref:hypothetical protein n=1 Tax=Lysinibacillus sp. NPDC094403 TaxID=3390581 RepID=UPI003D02EEC8